MQRYPDILRTLWFNLRYFGLRRGLKLPVYVYSKTKVYNLGRIEFNCPLRRGILRIGMHHDNSALPYTIIDNTGTIQVHGRTYLHHGSRLTNRGQIVFHGNDIISHNCVFDIRERLEIGHDVSVGYASEITDSDMHFMVDVNDRTVRKNSAPVRIGNYNWLGSHTYIKKGGVTPDHTIVASPNALIAKDYTVDTPAYSILGGAPAKVIGQGKQRIMKFHSEAVVIEGLKQSADQVFRLDESINIDEFCKLL